MVLVKKKQHFAILKYFWGQKTEDVETKEIQFVTFMKSPLPSYKQF